MKKNVASKILAGALASTMVLSMAACGNTKTQDIHAKSEGVMTHAEYVAAELDTDGEGSLGRLTRRQRLGAVYRCGGGHAVGAQEWCGIYVVGGLRPAQGCGHRCRAQLGAQMRSPLTPIGLQRLLRLPPLLKGQRLPHRSRPQPH